MNKEDLTAIFELMGYEIINYKGILTLDGNINCSNVGQEWELWGEEVILTGSPVESFKIGWFNISRLMAIAKQVKIKAVQKDKLKILNGLSESLMTFDKQIILDDLIHYCKILNNE